MLWQWICTSSFFQRVTQWLYMAVYFRWCFAAEKHMHTNIVSHTKTRKKRCFLKTAAERKDGRYLLFGLYVQHKHTYPMRQGEQTWKQTIGRANAKTNALYPEETTNAKVRVQQQSNNKKRGRVFLLLVENQTFMMSFLTYEFYDPWSIVVGLCDGL